MLVHVALALASLSGAVPASGAASAPPPSAAFAPLAQRHESKASPFDGLRWNDGVPEVDVERVWYRAVAIDGVSVADILEFCEKRWPGKREKRFGEDLVEAMGLMGHAPKGKVALDLVRLSDQTAVTLEGVVMSLAKRTAIRKGVAAPTGIVRREDALHDVEAFAARLRDQFSYRLLRGIDLDAEVERIEKELGDRVETNDLAEALGTLLYRFGDGHASVTSPEERRPAAYAPLLLNTAGGGVVAFKPDRSALADEARPFVIAIDGRPLPDWMGAVRPTVTAGSPQLIRQRSLRSLRDIESARDRLGVPAQNAITYTLSASPAGGDEADVTLRLARRKPIYGAWPRPTGEVATLSDGGRQIGYLRIARMDRDAVATIRTSMQAFRDCAGLIVDVRGNGGGRRDALLTLAGYLIGPKDEHVVGNVGAYIESELFDEDHLGGSRYMFREDDRVWSKAQRKAIKAFRQSFKPEWKLPTGFSDWHYLVLGPTGAEGEYHFSGPVSVLCDEGCFSATDIFLGALAELPRVTLVGTPSSGGSARSTGFTLPRTGIRVACASMASFQPNGRLYDGNGVEVDQNVERAPRDLLRGGSDSQLLAAIRALGLGR